MPKRLKKILVVVAHPDDEILGCGGTIARLVRQGYEVSTLILGEGVTSRDDTRNRARRNKEIHTLKTSAIRANKAIGVRKVFAYEFPDNRFDTIALLDIVKVIEKVKAKVKPCVIFTHYKGDLNIDHQITYKAVITATRPMAGEGVREIYSFQVPSSTEWSFPVDFSPNVFFDISKTIKTKVRAIKEYKSELKRYPHPRSIRGAELMARYWGMSAGVPFSEAFKLIRSIR